MATTFNHNDQVYVKDGNMGIGTDAPNSKLEVSGAGLQEVRVTETGNSVTSMLQTSTSYGWVGTKTNHTMYIGANDGAKITVLTGGNIGIGTTSPSSRLHVRQDGNSGLLLKSQNSDTGTSAYVEHQLISGTSGRELRIGASHDYPSPWNNAWIYAVNRDLALKSTANVKVYANGTTESNVITTTNQYGVGIKHVPDSNERLVVDTPNSVWGLLMVSGGVDYGGLHTNNGVLSLQSDGASAINLATANVGIGSTSPSRRLDVAGTWKLAGLQNSAYFASYDWGTELNISSITSGGWARANRITTSDSGGTVFFGVLGVDTTTTRAYWTVGDPNSINSTGYDTSSGIHLLKGGSVGIGTNAPGSPLTVRGGSSTVSIIGTNASGYTNIVFDGTGHGYSVGVGNDLATSISLNDKFYIYDSDNAASRLVIDTTGNIGIGTASPQVKLDVRGQAMFEGLVFANQSNQYNNSVPGNTSFGATTIDASVSYYDTGKNVSTDIRGIVWTGKHYIITKYSAQEAVFYDNNFDIIPNVSGSTAVTLPNPSGGSDHPHGAAWDGRYLYCIVYNGPGAKIVGYDIENGTTTADIVITSDVLNLSGATYGIEYAEGHLYVVTDGKVHIYKLEGKTITHVRTTADILSSIEAQAITYDGSYLWITQNGQSIFKVNLDGTLEDTVTTGQPPNNVGWAWNGENIVSVNYSTGDVYVINTAYKRIDTETLAVMGGSVGIGTTSPGAKLDIQGTGVAATPTVQIVNTSSAIFNHAINALAPNLTAGENNIFIIGRAASTKNSGYIGYKYSSGGSNDNVLTFGHWASDNLMNLTGDGNLGIGTESPSDKLHVLSGNIRITNSSPILYFYDSDVTDLRHRILGGGNAGLEYSADIGNVTSGYHRWDIANSEKMRLVESGRLGIGTTDPDTLLHVYGGGAPAIKIEALDTSSPSMTAHMIIQGYDGRGKGIFLAESGSNADREIFFGSTYSGGNANFTVGYENDGTGQAEYKAQSKFYIDLESGNVGINNTNPQERLHVYSAGTAATRIEVENTSGFAAFKATNDSGSYGWYVDDSSDSFRLFDFNDSADRVTVRGDGKVGISTVSPYNTLSVGAEAHYSPDDTNRILNWYTTTGGTEIGNSTILASIGNNNNATDHPRGIGLSLYNTNATNNTFSPALTFGGLSTSGNYMNGAAAIAAQLPSNVNDNNFRGGNLIFYTQGTTTATRGLTEKMRIQNDGNVGIGTTAPAQKLHVNGASIIADGNTAIDPDSSDYSVVAGAINDGGGWGVNSGIGGRAAGAGDTWAIGHNGSSLYFGIGDGANANSLDTFLRADTDLSVALVGYGSGTHTGTAVYKLSVDSSGNIIEQAIGAGAVDGSGTANYVTKWSDSDTLTDSIIYDNNKVHINGSNPLYILDVNGSFGVGGGTNSSNTYMYDAYHGASSAYFHQPKASVRLDSGATGSVHEAPVSLFLHNENGTNDTWVKLSMGSREQTSSGNTVSLAGIAAQKVSGTSGAWARGNLHLWTKNNATMVDAMTIKYDGNVGINTGTPGYKLDVNGNIRSFSTINVDRGSISGTAATLAEIRTINAFSYNTLRNGSTTGFFISPVDTNTPAIQVVDSSNNAQDLAIQPYGGSIGIGTKTPTAKLDIVGNIRADGELQFLRGAGTGDYSNYIRATNYPSEGYTSSTARYWLEYGAKGGHHFVVNTDGGSGSAENDYDDFTIWQGQVDGDRLFEVRNTGNAYIAGSVGIGTTSSSYKLTVQGASNGINLAGTGAFLRWNSGDIQISNEGSYKMGFYTYNTTAAALVNRMVIDTAGNVGIGTTVPSAKLEVYQSGSTALDIQGSQGQLFSVTDSLSGSLMSVNDITGIPILEVFSDDKVVAGQFGTNALVVKGANVGIGTGAPSHKLRVEGRTLINSGNGASTFNDLSIGGVDGWSSGEAHRINFVYGNNGGDIFQTIESYYNGTNTGRMRFRNFYTNAAQTGILMTIHSNGNVGIGDDNPARKLNVNGDFEATQITINNEFTFPTVDGNSGEVLTTNGSGTVSWGTVSGGSASSIDVTNTTSGTGYRVLFIDDTGTSGETIYVQDGGLEFDPGTSDLNVKGNVVSYATSDGRLKDNLTPIENALDKISQVSGYEFDWNDKQASFTGHDVGIVAQEIETILPEVVTERDNGYKAVKYEKIVPLLIEGIKEQKGIVEKQQKEIDELKSELKAIRDMLLQKP